MKKDSDALKKELEKEAPLLAGWQKKTGGFTVPPGYFNRLADQVLEKASQPVRRPLFLRYRLLAAAASVLVLVAVALFLLQPGAPASEPDTANLTTDEMHLYLSNQVDYFDLDLLLPYASAYPMQGLDEESELSPYLEEMLDDLDWKTINEIL